MCNLRDVVDSKINTLGTEKSIRNIFDGTCDGCMKRLIDVISKEAATHTTNKCNFARKSNELREKHY